jgi:signal transduction histidine kinase
LSLSKLEEGKIIPQPSKFNIIDFSKSLIEEIQDIKKNGQIINFVHNQLTQEVFLDPKLFKHIAFNLLSNAIKYSENNTEITYKIESNHSLLKIEIIDQGIGIPIEDQNNMFQRFYRAKNAANIEGTGLGLNIVKQYTKLMGGSIKFKSQLNEGSTFYIEFPLNLKK